MGAPEPRDIWLALLVAVVSLFSLLVRFSPVVDTPEGTVQPAAPNLLGAADLLVGCAALAYRRRSPGLVLAVCVASSLASYLGPFPAPPMPYAVLVATYSLAQRWTERRSAMALVLVAVCLGGASFVVLGSPDDDNVTVILAVVTAWALGRGARAGATHAALLEDRARLLEEQTKQLAREQQVVADAAGGRERAKLARELHDSVAGDLGLIATRATLALRRPDPSAATLRAALTSVESLGRGALMDLRTMVGVLQLGPDNAGATASARPRLDQLADLIAHVSAAGTPVRLDITGEVHALPPDVELDAYRIIQESLTNVIRHAVGATAVVRLDYSPDQLRIRVRDTGGRDDGQPSSGDGLAGMRERAEALGASIRAVRLDDGGFLVDVKIPSSAGRQP